MSNQHDFANAIVQQIPFLSRIILRMTRGDQVAEDIVQETIFKALVHADQFRYESTLRTWLGAIAINEVHQAYRSKWRTRTVPLITEAAELQPCDGLELDRDPYESKELQCFVRHAVERLPESYRSVVELCDLQCVRMDEAARKLGLTLSAVKSRRHRARQKLRPLVKNLHPKESACAMNQGLVE